MNDLVQLMRGKEADKQGKIVKINKAHTKVKVEGINVAVRHRKPSQGRPGEIVRMETYIDASNVMLVCPETKKPTRVGYKIENGKKIRISKKSGKSLDK